MVAPVVGVEICGFILRIKLQRADFAVMVSADAACPFSYAETFVGEVVTVLEIGSVGGAVGSVNLGQIIIERYHKSLSDYPHVEVISALGGDKQLPVVALLKRDFRVSDRCFADKQVVIFRLPLIAEKCHGVCLDNRLCHSVYSFGDGYIVGVSQ